MPRFAATTLGWTGGWACQLPQMRGQSPKAGGQDKGTGRRFLRRLMGLGVRRHDW